MSGSTNTDAIDKKKEETDGKSGGLVSSMSNFLYSVFSHFGIFVTN